MARQNSAAEEPHRRELLELLHNHVTPRRGRPAVQPLAQLDHLYPIRRWAELDSHIGHTLAHHTAASLGIQVIACNLQSRYEKVS